MIYRISIASITCALLLACAQPMLNPSVSTDRSPASPKAPSMETIIAAARADRSDATKRRLIIQTLMMQREVYVIPNPTDGDPGIMTLMEFPGHESSFIPVFSDRATFDDEARGTGYEGMAVPISARQFASLLTANQTVIVNPGDRPAIEFNASEIKSLGEPARKGT